MSFVIVVSLLTILVIFLTLSQILIGESKILSGAMLIPLESGFESLKVSALVSTSFFFLAMIFVLFDLELVLLFPGVWQFSVSWGGWVITLMVIAITLSLEWLCCGLKWSI